MCTTLMKRLLIITLVVIAMIRIISSCSSTTDSWEPDTNDSELATHSWDRVLKTVELQSEKHGEITILHGKCADSTTIAEMLFNKLKPIRTFKGDLEDIGVTSKVAETEYADRVDEMYANMKKQDVRKSTIKKVNNCANLLKDNSYWLSQNPEDEYERVMYYLFNNINADGQSLFFVYRTRSWITEDGSITSNIHVYGNGQKDRAIMILLDSKS